MHLNDSIPLTYVDLEHNGAAFLVAVPGGSAEGGHKQPVTVNDVAEGEDKVDILETRS